MILVEDWSEIRRLHRAEQMPIRAIARHLGISKNTVRRALASDRPPQYQRPAKGSCRRGWSVPGVATGRTSPVGALERLSAGRSDRPALSRPWAQWAMPSIRSRAPWRRRATATEVPRVAGSRRPAHSWAFRTVLPSGVKTLARRESSPLRAVFA